MKIYEATQADEFIPAVIIGNLGNADLGPEVSEELEAGLEASLWGGRASVDFTWYNQKTLDALIGVQEAPSFGTEEATLRNLGETKTWGTETTLNVVPIRSDNIEWSINAAYSTNDSEIVDMGPLTNLGFSLRVGQPLRVEYDQMPTNLGQAGQLPDYEDQVVGVTWPTKLFSLGTRITLNQSLTLDVLGEGQAGHYKAIGIGWATVRRETWPACFGILNAWNEAAAALPSTATGAQVASQSNLTPEEIGLCVPAYSSWGLWTDAADFFKLRSASLSYRLPDDLVPGARSVTLALQARNLFMITDYQGLDPEATDRGFGNNVPYEYYNMAPPRIFILNATVNF